MATEKRLIDANEFKRKMKLEFLDRRNKFISLKDLFECIDDMATVDAVEVKHGWWDKYTDERFNGYDADGRIKYRKVRTYNCNKCGHGSAVKSNYCPNCGAKMDGGVNCAKV